MQCKIFSSQDKNLPTTSILCTRRAAQSGGISEMQAITGMSGAPGFGLAKKAFRRETPEILKTRAQTIYDNLVVTISFKEQGKSIWGKTINLSLLPDTFIFFARS